MVGRGGGGTFLSLSFSVFSSLLAFAACRFSCLAVNCMGQSLAKPEVRGERQAGGDKRTYLQIEERFLEARHDG